MIHSWGNHFGKRTEWLLIYFLIYAYLNILAQSKNLGNNLYVLEATILQMLAGGIPNLPIIHNTYVLDADIHPVH